MAKSKKAKKSYSAAPPMRVQARPGSIVERRYTRSALPSGAWPRPAAIAPGISPSPLDDLLYHGGKVVPQMEFQNIYLGSAADWTASDVDLIDTAINRAMRHRRLENVMKQYFPGVAVSCDPRESLALADAKPGRLDEPDIQARIIDLYDRGQIRKSDLGSTLFNLILPAGSVLELEGFTSLGGLGGYHGSVHFKRNGKRVTLYYSANVYSQPLAANKQNGIVAFNRPWKNVVGTLYHEINEFRTDADVNDAIRTGDDAFLGWMSRDGQEVGDQPISAADSLNLVFKEIRPTSGTKRIPVQYMYSNVVHGAEGPIAQPH